MSIAEQLFQDKGYKAVKLREIAKKMNIKQASLYYHFPKGKEQLFLEVTKRKIAKENHGLKTAISSANTFVGQINAIFEWISHQPPMRMLNLMLWDMHVVSKETAAILGAYAQEKIFDPISQVFLNGIKKGEINAITSPEIMTGTVLAIFDGVDFVPQSKDPEMKLKMLSEVLKIILYGLLDQNIKKE